MTKLPTSLLALCMIFIITPVVTASGESTKPIVNICCFPMPEVLHVALHNMAAVEYYRDQFPHIEWRFHVISSPLYSVEHTIRSWIFNGTSCDLLVGPVVSSHAVAIGPLVKIPWISGTASSTELSSKLTFPSFSRVIPNDEDSAVPMGHVFKEFNWKQINILCVDTAYGRSAASGISRAIAALDGVVEVSRCFEQDASYERVVSVMDQITSARSRVTVMSGSPFGGWFASFMQVVLERQLYKTQLFVFTEAFCSGETPSTRAVPGALCITYFANDLIMNPFLLKYDYIATSTRSRSQWT
eukprot:PhM_4_TR4159/c2_g1_i2/m.73940